MVFGGIWLYWKKNRVSVSENYSDNSKKYLTDELFPNILLYFLKPNEVYTSNIVVYNQLPSKFAVKVGLYYMAYRFPKRNKTCKAERFEEIPIERGL